MTQNRPKIVDPRQAERRRSLLFKIAAAVALIAVAAGVTIWAVVSNSEDSSTGGSSTPTAVTDNGAIRLSGAPATAQPKVVISIVEDFGCPACRSFEDAYGPTLKALSERNDVAVDYRPTSILDRVSTTKYSSRAMNASLCVAEATTKGGNTDIWMTFHNSLFANQPAEGGAGLSDDKLKSLAKDAGAQGVGECITSNQFGKWVTNQTRSMSTEDGFEGTPWVRVNGKDFAWNQQSPEQLTALVDAAVK